MASHGERKEEAIHWGDAEERQQRSILEHPVILVNLDTDLGLNPFLIISNESTDMLVTGTRVKQNPNTGSFLLDNKRPVMTT